MTIFIWELFLVSRKYYKKEKMKEKANASLY